MAYAMAILALAQVGTTWQYHHVFTNFLCHAGASHPISDFNWRKCC